MTILPPARFAAWRRRFGPCRAPAAAWLVLLLVCAPAGAPAQQPRAPAPHAPAGDGVDLGVHAIGLLTHARPAIAGSALTEAYLTQPMLLGAAHVAGGTLSLSGVLNLEGITLERGELNAGVWGEGYIDRRHPHAYLHELMATLQQPVRGVTVSLAAGRGFAPFGTDDPMVRPFVKYPANHHLAQVLERWAVIAAARRGRFIIDAGIFAGDEPAGPRAVGRLDRLGDSWAARGTVLAGRGLEVQASHARVASPELPAGGGPDHVKSSAAMRWDGTLPRAARGYALLEWARTTESDGSGSSLSFRTALAEAALTTRHGARAALRLERTTRPEAERGFDPFRTPRPHAGPLLGITEWTIATVHLAARASLGGVVVEPFVEGARLHVRETSGGAFRPERFYGDTLHWSASLGVRLAAGMRHERMGRYGAAVPTPAHAQHSGSAAPDRGSHDAGKQREK